MRKLSLTALLLLGTASLVACGDKDDTAAPEGDTDTDTDADTDTDTDADGDADGDADADPSSCGPWTGIQGVGTAWSYSMQDASLRGTVDNLITAYDAGTGLVTSESVSDLVGDGYTMESTTVSEYRCDDDGFWLLTQYTEYAMDYGGTPFDGWTDTIYEPAALIIPKSLDVGDTWTTSYTGTTETNVTDPTAFSSSVLQQVVEQSSVTVPAGTYDTLYIEYDGDGSGYSHVARDVGQVKSNITELTSYTP
jgi:predicted small lipoprotein YifL